MFFFYFVCTKAFSAYKRKIARKWAEGRSFVRGESSHSVKHQNQVVIFFLIFTFFNLFFLGGGARGLFPFFAAFFSPLALIGVSPFFQWEAEAGSIPVVFIVTADSQSHSPRLR